MKIAIVIERIEMWRGGAETLTTELAHLLAARGHEVHILTSSRCPSPPDLTIHQLTVSNPIKPLRLASFARKVKSFLASHRFDIVHAVFPLPEADVYQPRGGSVLETLSRNVAMRGSPMSRMAKRMTQSLNVKQGTLLSLERLACRPGGARIAAVSKYVAEQFERHYGLREPRVRVVFNGVDVEPATDVQRAADRRQVREQFGAADDDLVLLCIAHNFRLKGVGKLIETQALLQRSGMKSVRAWIAGRDNPAPFQRQALSLGVADRIVFTGPTQRAAAFMHAADVLMHPTYYDPCSRVVLEALCHGLPPITTRCNGAAEVIKDGVSGFVVESPDAVERMAECVQLLSEPSRRAEMAAAGRAMLPRLSMKRHVDELITLYEDVVRERGSR